MNLTRWHVGTMPVQITHEIFSVQQAARSLTTAIMEWLHAEGKVESPGLRLAID